MIRLGDSIELSIITEGYGSWERDMKNAAVVTCFESNEERAALVIEILKDKGYDTVGISSDFSHIRKAKRTEGEAPFTLLKTRPYKKNLSIGRLLSHRSFARDVFQYLNKIDPDLIWACVPANSLIEEAKRYKDRHPDVKIILDEIDMWPESLPIGPLKKTFPFALWKNVRSNSIDCADVLVVECDYYKEILRNEYKGPVETIRWARKNKVEDYPLELPENKLSLAYIGSINNIIDIEEMGRLIKTSDMPVELHVIGDGENKKRFLDVLGAKCELIDHGVVYDSKEKQKIFAKCHAGLNIYKEGLYIGLTVKSIDYFNYGLPIINSIKGDTYSLIKDYKVGFNVDKSSSLNAKEIIEMRKNNLTIFEVYNNNFTREVFAKRVNEVVDLIE